MTSSTHWRYWSTGCSTVSRSRRARCARPSTALHTTCGRRSTDCRHDAPAVVQGNRQLLAQLLTNLIENGLKYVPAGGRIEVAVRRLSHSVRLTVSDNGPGIATEDRLRAAQPFVRLGTSPRGEGSGLGLSLVAAIARPHRGRRGLEGHDPGLKVVIELPA